MNIIDCPHCYARVAVASDGTCPSCRRDTDDTSDADLTRAQMKVSASAVLPHVCFNCATTTEKAVVVRRERKEELDDQTQSTLALLSAFASLLYLIPLLFARPKKVVEIEMPICGTCLSMAVAPEPTRTDFENETMLMVVHKEFKRQAIET